ncbi:MAG: aminopeptidase [Pseudomonadota bacterium]
MRVSWLAVLLLLSSCSTVSYYSHVLRGGLSVLQAREPIDRIIADPRRDATLRARLKGVQAARQFAVKALALPDNDSYTEYSELHRPFVVWNVFAAPELSLTAITHCFPIAGCVGYRGYYDQKLATSEAERLRAEGSETFVGGVSAYSTLGWFDDPVLSSMLRWDDERLAGTLFHELAHQIVYVQDDTAFNESFAQFVEMEGLQAWRLARGLPAALPPDLAFEAVFIERLLQARSELERLYASPVHDDAKRAGKAEVLERLQAEVQRLATAAEAGPAYQRFFATPMNNAKLLPFGLYHQWQGAFGVLFRQQGSDWPRFHAAVRTLAKLDASERGQQLKSLQAQADATPK